MKPLSRYEIRLNLIDLATEFFQDTYADGVVDDGTEGHRSLLQMLKIYRADTLHQMAGWTGSEEDLWTYLNQSLKVGVRLAGSLMADVQEEHGELLSGWYHGCQPRNMVQAYYNLLSETALELSISILAAQSKFPEYQWLFDQERADYARITEQWRLEDEAEHEQTN